MNPFVLNLSRVFDAPRETVFNAWVDPKQMAKWWGPHGFSAPECRMDIRPGGEIFILMRGFGQDHPMSGVVREVKAPERFVFEATALDDKGGVLLVSLTTVTFADLGGKTQVDVKAEATPKQPLAEGMIGGMTQGWNESLDKLGALLQ